MESLLDSNLNEAVTYREFFRAFGYLDNDPVYIRTFNDRDNKQPGQNFSVPLFRLDSMLPALKSQNSQNRWIFFVVNGDGQSDSKVKHARAQFMEIDSLPMEEQLKLISFFPLEPSIIIRTRKSLHCYWLLNDGQIKFFRELQQRLAQHFNSDPTIQNESRVMRLYGFEHRKADPVVVRLIKFNPELRYTQRQLHEVLPRLKARQHRNPAPAGEIIPEGQRHYYVIRKIGEFVTKLGSSADDESILAMVEADFFRHCENAGNVNMDSFRQKYLKAIADFRTRTEAEEKDTGFYSYALKAWKRENPGKAFDSASTSWEEVRNAGRRAHDAGWMPPERPKTDDSILSTLKAIKPEKAYKWDDKGNGELYADIFQKVVRWNVTVKEWFHYTGQIWTEDTGGMIASRLAKQLADALLMYCTTIDDEKTRADYIKHVAKLGQLKFRQTMLTDARDKYFLSSEMLDKDKYILNVENGVLDLRTMKFMKHDPSQLLSKMCRVTYDPDARGERWTAFINSVMMGDTEKIDFLQRILGYSLTGNTQEETCYILYGQSTRNGKSTLVETIGYLLDGYALNMRPESLAQKKDNDSRRASSDIARLKDCRFLNASEPPKRMIFDVALLKTLLGRDTITARFLHQNEIQFTPSYKLFINTNYLPLITDETLFTSGRITVITFDRHFKPEEQDKHLKDRLRDPETLSGVLNWCIEGLKKYMQSGAKPPQAVIDATEDYRRSSDKLGQFFSERMEKSPGRNTSAGAVYTVYSTWCADNGYGCENKGNFFADLQSRGVFSRTGTVNGKSIYNIIKNYTIRSDFETTDDEFPLTG